jgi:bifunctional DNA-binding transcriptional regulator/antitoxin component of YhaV-PrlF toxin-antitoxin module
MLERDDEILAEVEGTMIPSEVRESMGINPGDKLVALYLDEKKSVAFITERQAQEFVIKMGEQYTEFKTSFDSTEKS